MTDLAIVWFRQDLRCLDNPALYHAAKNHENIIPVYILDESADRPMGGASKWWLHHSLNVLSKTMPLILRKGSTKQVLQELIKESGAKAIYWNKVYEPSALALDEQIESSLGVECKSFNGSLLFEPDEIMTQQGKPYKVYTPFKNSYWKKGIKRDPLKPVKEVQATNIKSDKVGEWDLLPNWGHDFESYWQPGEEGAFNRFDEFMSKGISNYDKARDIPSMEGVSRLSPHLHFGEISPVYIWHQVNFYRFQNPQHDEPAIRFLNEIIWRDFGCHLLYHFPDLPHKNFKSKFDNFPWAKDKKMLKAWQNGMTGYPIVDAGMRELWKTGFMHNRVRMIVASYLIKDLFIHWKEGEEWFWDTLVDADLASNSANWQWVAGSGADAAPYFRIFNPTSQGERFDPDGAYIKKWVPELENVPVKFIHKPWEYDSKPKAYPDPIVDHKERREFALKYYKELNR